MSNNSRPVCPVLREKVMNIVEESEMGFDHLAIGSLTRPMLATVHNDPYMDGRGAGEQLLKLLRNEQAERMSTVPHCPVIRQSVSALPG
jgi:LacI family transcriptional regulator